MQVLLSLCVCIPNESLARVLLDILSSDRYNVNPILISDFLDFVEENKEKIDCLIVLNQSSFLPIFNQLYEQGTFLPTILIEERDSDRPVTGSSSTELETRQNSFANTYPTCFYHNAEIRLPSADLEKISATIEIAITQFLDLGSSRSLSEKPTNPIKINQVDKQKNSLLSQQHRLAEKLKERLGYLGVYYKRHPQYFYRNLSQDDKQQLLEQLSIDYREIILSYFVENSQVNLALDQFVNRAFFADLSASQVLEIHMELMDEFSAQLKLEGRSEEILLDYRLVLIDILAHLGEMYRRSIPREDISGEPPYQID